MLAPHPPRFEGSAGDDPAGYDEAPLAPPHPPAAEALEAGYGGTAQDPELEDTGPTGVLDETGYDGTAHEPELEDTGLSEELDETG